MLLHVRPIAWNLALQYEYHYCAFSTYMYKSVVYILYFVLLSLIISPRLSL